MDFLVHPPNRKKQIHNSFRGADKHDIFMRKIGLVFASFFRVITVLSALIVLLKKYWNKSAKPKATKISSNNG